MSVSKLTLTFVVLAILAFSASALEWNTCSLKAGRSTDIGLKLVESAPIETMVRGWEWSLNFVSELSAPLIKGDITVSLLSKESGKVVYDLTLPLCGEWSDDACALNWNGTELSGLIPVYVPISEELGVHTVQVYIRGVGLEGDEFLESCHATEVELVERQLEGCPSKCGAALSRTPRGSVAYSNAGNQGTGYSCGGWGKWGYHFQCVELPQRDNKAMWPVSFARQMCASRPAGFRGVSTPGVNDVFVANWAPYGHTAVVARNNGNGYVTVIEQNGKCSGKTAYSKGNALCFLRR